MEWIINQLRDHPELAIFLTLFAGFWLGRFKIGKFSLGTVTSVLLVGVLVGQLNNIWWILLQGKRMLSSHSVPDKF